jgi:hypothetical protein
MAAPHDRPTIEELVEAVREWLENDVMSSTEGRLRFHTRVAVNMLAMVERELAVGGAQADRHAARLAQLGVTDDSELASAIAERRFDDRAEEVRDLLRASVVDKLSVANPKYLADADASAR